MTDDVLDRAQHALNGVTDGPWVASGTWLCGEVDACTCDGPSEYHGHRRECGLEPLANIGNEKVARFIAAARTLVPELADALRAARTENEQLRTHLAAVPSAIRAYAGGELDGYSYHGDGSAIEALRRLSEHAENIRDYAGTRETTR